MALGPDGADLSCGINDEVKKHFPRQRSVEGRTKNVDWLCWDNVRFFKDWCVFLRYVQAYIAWKSSS